MESAHVGWIDPEGFVIIKVYFCDPQSPRQRGTNETPICCCGNTSREAPTCPPYSQAQLDQVSLRLNQRPRKTLGFHTPASKLQASVASTI